MPFNLDPATLRTAIREAMTMRSGAAHVAAWFERAGGPAEAAGALESLIVNSARTDAVLAG